MNRSIGKPKAGAYQPEVTGLSFGCAVVLSLFYCVVDNHPESV